MKKLIAILIVSLLVVVGGMFSQASAQLMTGVENVLYFNNFENVFDANGNYVIPGTDIQVGDHLFGIINVQNIDTGGTTHWFSGPNNQLTGVFAQRIDQILLPDPLDLANILPHFVLGAPTVSIFNGPDGSFVNTAGMLSGNEMFAFYLQMGVGTTTFESNGTMAQDVAVATDGSLWMTLGYDNNGTDGFADDTGYAYSHVGLTGQLDNYTGETWAQLDVIQNLTGYGFAGIGDPNENEVEIAICGSPGCLLNDMYLSGELELNPFSQTIFGRGSPWDVRSQDPAHIIPVPEPATMLLLGAGLLGLGAYSRRRKK